MLKDKEWSGWSDNIIAETCAVSQPFVSKLRKSSYNDYKIDSKRTVKRGNQEYEVDTTNIGNKSKDIPENVDSETGEVYVAKFIGGLKIIHVLHKWCNAYYSK